MEVPFECFVSRLFGLYTSKKALITLSFHHLVMLLMYLVYLHFPEVVTALCRRWALLGTSVVLLRASVSGTAMGNGNIRTICSSMTLCNLIRTPKFLFLCSAFNIFSVLLLGDIYADFLLGGYNNIGIYIELIKHVVKCDQN